MRILFVFSDNSPFAPKQGAEQRTCLLLKACIRMGDVDVIDFCDDEVSDTYGANVLYSKELPSNANSINTRKDKIVKILTSFLPSRIASIDRGKEDIIDYYVQKNNYDYIVTRYAILAVNCGLYKYASKLVVDVDDNPVDKIKIQGGMSPTSRTAFFYCMYAHNVRIAMRLFEKRVRKVFYSNIDDCSSRNSIFLPNIPYYEIEQPLSRDRIVKGRLLFVGDMRYSPNIEAVNRFLDNIYPSIVAERSDVSFHIVGKCIDQMSQKWESYPGVKVMGFVPSLDNEYSEASVFVLPMYNGGGTCIKFLEAAQMGRPIVSTQCGFRGYSHYFDGKSDCCIATDDNAFSKMVIELLGDEHLRNSIADSAYSKFKQYYSHHYFDNVVKNALTLCH